MQSVPRAHMLPSAPSPPSWQCLLLVNRSPPLLKGERHVFSQILAVDTVTAPTKSNMQAAANNLSRKERTACRREVVGMGGRKGGKGRACEKPS